MGFRFGLVAIVLILDVVSVWSTGNGFIVKNSNAVQLSQDSLNNSAFYQPSINGPKAPAVDNFTSPTSSETQHPTTHAPLRSKDPLRINLNCQIGSERPISGFKCVGYVEDIANTTSTVPVTNPSLNAITDSPLNFSLPRPVMQRPYIPRPYYYTSTPIFNTPAPVDNSFTTSRTPISSQNDHSNSVSPPLDDILPTNSVAPISERKCGEYEREIVNLITSLTGSSSDVNSTCFRANHLVVGNNLAQIGEFPHIVALGRRNFNRFMLMCTGTLISHTWVLTAAHCIYGSNGAPTEARMDINRLKDQPGVTVAIKNIIRHPDYNPPALYADIALVQLTNFVTFSTLIRPACLYQNYDTVPTQAWISGWDITEYNGKDRDRLQKAQLDMVDNLFCTVRYNSSEKVPYGVTTSMICAGDPHGNWTKDGCQGDSGGPLQAVHSDRECLFQVIGILSFSKGCGLIDIPGVYTRLSHYLPWIEENVWPQG
ncbi:serine protease snake-like isoform X2 [Monomorium pharaonis]|uniref:serine protease snake isoform X2 n=1 Tax=Monomorium pharaonis TaxID=307658 RepID=UPI00063F8B93|nr:serine protease snake isoform X2 [Monomorium pharaonis]XP_036142422.1 serine protease snake-like isoform X2 [Monomorium pharaonis]